MRAMRTTGRHLAAMLLFVATTGALAACGGSEPPPSEQVPALGRQLDRIDAAVEAGDYDAARAAVKDLVAEAARAQVDGDLPDDQAQRIVTAARSVLENLPDGGDGQPG